MRHGIKVLGLVLLAAISVMAVTAASAYAGEGTLRVNGKALNTTTEMASGEGTTEAGKFLVPGLGIVFRCQGGQGSGEGGNLVGGHLHALLLALLEGCEVEGNKNCTIYPTEEDLLNKTHAGHIQIHALLLWLIRWGGTEKVDIIRATVAEGLSSFATWYYGGALCALPEETEVSGTTAGKIPEATTELVNHKLEDLSTADEAKLASEGMKLGLKYGEESAELVGGGATRHLTGALEGLKFSVE